MPVAARHLAVEELEQVALVVDLGEAVDDGEPVDLFVNLRLDRAQLPPEEEFEDGRADLDQVARPQGRLAAHLDVVEIGAVGRAAVVEEGAVGLEQDRAMLARDVVDPLERDGATLAAADGDLPALERDLLAQTGSVDLHEAGFFAPRALHTCQCACSKLWSGTVSSNSP